MLMLNRRLQVLVDEARWQRLSQAAQRRRVSVAVVVRDALDRALDDPDQQDRDEAVERLLAADPISVPLDPADLRSEIMTAHDRFA